MLIVTVDIWPCGDSSRARSLGQLRISNDGTGTHELGNYIAKMSTLAVRAKDADCSDLVSVVKKHPRELNVWYLVKKAIDKCLRATNSKKPVAKR